MRAPFSTWAAFRSAAERSMDRKRDAARIYYKAPMDRFACSVRVIQLYANGKVKIEAGTLRFTIDKGHIDRLSWE